MGTSHISPNKSFCFLQTPRSGTARSYGSTVLNCLRNLHTVFLSGYTKLHCHQQCMRVLSLPHPCQHLLFAVFLIMTILCDVTSHCSVLFLFFFPFSAATMAYGSSWAKDQTWAGAWPTPQLHQGQILNPLHQGRVWTRATTETSQITSPQQELPHCGFDLYFPD